MPLDGSGIAVRLPDTIAISGQTIESDKYNREINDLISMMNRPRPVSSGGTGADNPTDALANLGGISAANVLAKYISYVVAQTLNDAQKIQARANIGAAPDTVTGVLVGSFIWVAMAAAPSGYLKANGLTIGSATSGATGRANADAAALFTVLWNNVPNTVLPIQNSLGANVLRGTTAAIDFAANKRLPLPDMRGEFVRSFSDGRAGVDVGRVLGSAQVEMVGPHTHDGVTDPDGSHNHTFTGGGGSGNAQQYRDGSVTDPNGITSTAPDHTHAFTTDNNAGTENRVRNIALLCCIKY
jgi:hypothetical protein